MGIRIVAICGGGLGYKTWLQTQGYGAQDVLLLPCGKLVARCHPAITATEEHARVIGGVEVGMQIQGVRWTEPYIGQEVCNPPEA